MHFHVMVILAIGTLLWELVLYPNVVSLELPCVLLQVSAHGNTFS